MRLGDQLFDLLAIRFLMRDLGPKLGVQITNIRDLLLELFQSLLVLKVVVSLRVKLFSQCLILDILDQFFFQDLQHRIYFDFGHESVVTGRFHNQMLVLFEEVIRFPDVLLSDTLFVFDHHQLNDQ